MKAQVQSYSFWAALVVEVYKTLVDRHPELLQVPYLARIIDALMPHWIEWRVEKTMASVDAQAQRIAGEPELMPVVFTETLEGETPLGGEMRLKSDISRD